MGLSQYRQPEPAALRGFIEGLEGLQEYLRTNAGKRLNDAEQQFDQSLAAQPDFVPAQYYKAIVLTHARKADEAIEILEVLDQEEVPFRAEVLYNLAFAYAKTYRYENVKRGLEVIDKAEEIARQQERDDLELLAQAMKAFVRAVFGAYELGNPDDFVFRQKEYLPKSVVLAKSVLDNPKLKSLPLETNIAVQVEANNAAGGACMYMGQYSGRFESSTRDYWKLAEDHLAAALRLHPRNVRALDNLATLKLMAACRAMEHEELGDAKKLLVKAVEIEKRAVSYHPHDRFRYVILARSYALAGKWKDAEASADSILKEPGDASEEEAKKLKDLIEQRDIEPILKRYRTEEKSMTQ